MTSQTIFKKFSGLSLVALSLFLVSVNNAWARDSAEDRANAAADRQAQQDDQQFEQYQRQLEQMQQAQNQALMNRFNTVNGNRTGYPAGYNDYYPTARTEAAAAPTAPPALRAAARPAVKPITSAFDMAQANAAINRDLNGELARTQDMGNAKIQAAGMTAQNEAQRVRDLAAWETQMANSRSTMTAATSRGTYRTSTLGPSAAEQAQIDYFRNKGLSDAETAARLKTEEYNDWMQKRSDMLNQSAQSLQEQLANPGNGGANLQSVGTNLYVRQYGDPGAVLPPVHNAAARIVPHEGPDK